MQHLTTAADPAGTNWHDGVSSIAAAEWDRLAGPDNPFLRHAFLAGLEEFGCLAGHGWTPCPVTLRQDGRLIGAAPLYLRTNSYGEFVFDWAWADAFERAGGRYYPKLVSAIPFTPVRGARLLVDPDCRGPDAIRRRLAGAILEFCGRSRLSSFHCLFPDAADSECLSRLGLLGRITCQFRWMNRGYRDFQDFLDSLTSRRRKEIRRERRAVADAGVEIVRLNGAETHEREWREFYGFYCSTFARRWGSPRLTLPFFESLSTRMPREALLILARRNGRWIAGAFAMRGSRGVYGRHWGCAEDLPFLHFELCYHQTIEYCIQEGLEFVDAGVQGEHKLTRGFEPVGIRSCHWLGHEGFRNAVRDYLDRETPVVEDHISMLREHLPFKATEAASPESAP
ncbi:MAG TPA: GNAT family N-acetyltransferase [Gammaproteobacteria bacterium]